MTFLMTTILIHSVPRHCNKNYQSCSRSNCFAHRFIMFVHQSPGLSLFCLGLTGFTFSCDRSGLHGSSTDARYDELARDMSPTKRSVTRAQTWK
ncbi:hypothetical protein RRG08_039235 [Elysia crispata]|uniref:Uncharacterized protein n=1 Tax=Elysia crispata TaxID=231223 RepID=A0AAE1EE64_9GAST|nr:hypothetical protein RRG08_039235 [Elysia crispata]